MIDWILDRVGWFLAVAFDDRVETICLPPYPRLDGRMRADLTFIAAANPQAILSLCEELERKTKAATTGRDLLQRWLGVMDCDCENGHRCGRQDVKRAVAEIDAALTPEAKDE